MLVPLASILEKQPSIKSAIVVGAGELEQKREFDLCEVTDVRWVEARPYAVSYAKDKYPRADVVQACVTGGRHVVKFWELHPSSVKFSGVLESLLALNNKVCPHARVRGHRFFNTTPLDALTADRKFDLLQLDVCGLELAILKSLQNVPPVVHVKVYAEPLFHNAATASGVDAFFGALGYACVLEQWQGVVGEKVFVF